MKYLTPVILREAASYLVEDITGLHSHGQEFMCCAVRSASPRPIVNEVEGEFTEILRSLDVELSGSIGYEQWDKHGKFSRVTNQYYKDAPSVRFMFLHFLALSLED